MLSSTHGGHPNAAYRVLFVDYGEEENEVPASRVRRAAREVELALERATAGPGVDDFGRDLRAGEASFEPDVTAPWALDATRSANPLTRERRRRSPPRPPGGSAAAAAEEAPEAAAVLHPRLLAPGGESEEAREDATREAFARARAGLVERQLLHHEPQPGEAGGAGAVTGGGGQPEWKKRLLAAREARRQEQEGRGVEAQRERERREAEARRIAKETALGEGDRDIARGDSCGGPWRGVMRAAGN